MLPTACLPSLWPHQMSHTSAQSIVILRPQGSRRWLLNSSLLMPTFLPRRRIAVTTSMNGGQTAHSSFFQALKSRSQETLLPRELPGSCMALRWGQEKILRNWTGNVVLQSYVSIIYLQNKFWPNAYYLMGVCSKHLTKYWILFLFWPFHIACRIIVPQLETETLPPAVEAWGLNHWTTMEVPVMNYFNIKKKESHLPWKKYPPRSYTSYSGI